MRKKQNQYGDSYVLDELGQMFEWPQPVECYVTDGQVKTEQYEDVQVIRPLQDPDFFLSFARLGARGEASAAKIRKWTLKYGLLNLGVEDRWGKKPVTNTVPLTSFREEVRRAHQLLHLYTDIQTRNHIAISGRVADPTDNVDKQVAEGMNSNDYWRGTALVRAGVLSEANLNLFIARKVLADTVADLVKDVSIKPLAVGAFNTEQSYDCPDLLAALYLQFHLLVISETPMRYCDHPNCKLPFPATRNNKRFCSKTCRSGARYQSAGSET